MKAVPINNFIPVEITESESGIQEIVGNIISEMISQQNKILEDSICNFAEPPIKGNITKGKLKWRGIHLIINNNYSIYTMQLEQRGKKISPLIVNKIALLGQELTEK